MGKQYTAFHVPIFLCLFVFQEKQSYNKEFKDVLGNLCCCFCTHIVIGGDKEEGEGKQSHRRGRGGRKGGDEGAE